MFKNYFILNRLILENNSLLKDYTLHSAYTQEKDKLVFEVSNNGDKKAVEVSAAPNFEYMIVRESFTRAKKNTAEFFETHLPSKIISFEISDHDRIIKIKLESSSLYFFIRGNLSNVILVDNAGNMKSFKKINSQALAKLRSEINDTKFISLKNEVQLNLTNEIDYLAEAKKNFPFLGKDILNELKFRRENAADNSVQNIFDGIIDEIFTGDIAVYYDTEIGREKLSIKTFAKSNVKDINEFDNVNEAMLYFLRTKYYQNNFINLKNKIDKFLEKEIEKTVDRLNNYHVVLQSKSREDEYNKIANLLLININSIGKGADKIKLEDIYDDNKPVEIKIDKTISPRQNAEAYFGKAKTERYKFERAGELIKALTNKLDKLKRSKEIFSASTTTEDLKNIMKEINMPANEQHEQTDDIKNKFRNFVIDGKYSVFVGKDSANNDLLTTKFAKQNDYWFHARSVSGSHVVLRVDNTKEAVPKNILKKAAALAAFYSKAKTSGVAPVSYSLKKYVVKKKGMEPGKVAMLKEDVLIVKPEIPAGCEMLNKE